MIHVTPTDSATFGHIRQDSATFGHIREDLAPNKVIAGEVPIAWIRPSALNPRKHFDESALQELAASIQEHGIIEPIVVREIAEPPIDEERLARGRKRLASFEKSVREDIEKARAESGGWGWCRFTLLPREWDDVQELYRAEARELGLRIEDVQRSEGSTGRWRFRVSRLTQPRYAIIAGERRYRAAQLAGLETVPCRKLDHVDDATALRLALVENLQRQDLDPIEEAEGYRQLNRVCGLKQTEIAAAVKRSQPVIANAMRLLDLPDDVQERIRQRELSPSHGVALARFRDFPAVASNLAELAVINHWTSSQLEGEKIPGHWQLVQRGVTRALWNASFDQTICRKCPFNARRHAQGDVYEYCLKPDHFDELAAAAKAKSEAKVQANLEAAKAAGADVDELPKLENLKYDQYARVEGYNKPSGCTENCPCRGRAIDYNGKVIAICTNPRRYKSLQSQDTKARNKERKAQHDQVLAKLRAHLEGLTSYGSRELAILLMALLRSYTLGLQDHAEVAGKEYGITVSRASYEPWPQNIPHFDEFARHGDLDILRLALEAILRQDLANQMQAPASAGGWVTWYLGLDENKPEALASGDTPTADSERTENAYIDVPARNIGRCMVCTAEPVPIYRLSNGIWNCQACLERGRDGTTLIEYHDEIANTYPGTLFPKSLIFSRGEREGRPATLEALAGEDDEAERCTKCRRELSEAELDVDEALCFDCMGDEEED